MDKNSEYPPFLGSEIEPSAPEQAFFQVVPAPFERSVCYGTGTARGPAAILLASWQLDPRDGDTRPGDAGIHTRSPVDCSGKASEVLERIAGAVRESAGPRRLPVLLGGEHTVTLGAVRGLLAAGLESFGVLQVDAHADLRDSYGGDPLSHATVMRRVAELGIPVFQLGVRTLGEEEVEARRRFGVGFRDAEELVTKGVTEIALPEDFPSRIYITLDVDGLDPAIMPATGTPVPGGLGWYQTLSLLRSALRGRSLIGFDLVEFAPIAGYQAWDFTAAALVYKLMALSGIEQRA